MSTNRKTLQAIEIGGETVYVESSYADYSPSGQDDSAVEVSPGREYTSADDGDSTVLHKLQGVDQQIRHLVQHFSLAVAQSLHESQPHEWSVELNFGIGAKGKVLFLAEGTMEAAIKVKAVWKRDS